MRYLFSLLFCVSSLALSAQSSLQYNYHRLEGSISNSPVVVHLHTMIRNESPGPDPTPQTLYFGTYYYTKYMIPIQLEGSTDSTGNITLYEWNGEEITGSFSLNSGWKGTWSNPEKTKNLQVILDEKYPVGSVRFSSGAEHTSLPWKVELPNSPAAHLTMFYLAPEWYVDAQKTEALKKVYMKEVMGGRFQSDTCCSSMSEFFEKIRSTSFQSFEDRFQDMELDSIPEYMQYGIVEELQTKVLFNDAHLLSMGFYEYEFSGGAHGMYQTRVMTFDLINQRVLGLQDVFKKGFEPELMALLERVARKRAGLDEDESFEQYYFTPDIPVTENFYLTPKGIVFSYPPYEIAAYAAGQIEFFIPFADISEWLQPGIGE
jgi:hypothetical protein